MNAQSRRVEPANAANPAAAQTQGGFRWVGESDPPNQTYTAPVAYREPTVSCWYCYASNKRSADRCIDCGKLLPVGTAKPPKPEEYVVVKAALNLVLLGFLALVGIRWSVDYYKSLPSDSFSESDYQSEVRDEPYYPDEPSGSDTSSGSYGGVNCDAFSTHREAQAFFEDHGGPGYDPYDLDGDSDGSACEWLP
jgi:hypothetical protein